MLGFIKISEMSSLAIHSMILLAYEPDSLLTIKSIAYDLGASEAHLAKVLQKLAKDGLVKSTRGPKGGFSLAKSASEITFLQIYESIEGSLKARTDCPLKRDECPFKSCTLQSTITKCINIFMSEFFNKTLAEVLAN